MGNLIKGRAFNPTVGKCYEIHFGIITIDNKSVNASVCIKANGNLSKQWIDLKTGEILDPRIGAYVVKEFKEISCD